MRCTVTLQPRWIADHCSLLCASDPPEAKLAVALALASLLPSSREFVMCATVLDAHPLHYLSRLPPRSLDRRPLSLLLCCARSGTFLLRPAETTAMSEWRGHASPTFSGDDESLSAYAAYSADCSPSPMASLSGGGGGGSSSGRAAATGGGTSSNPQSAHRNSRMMGAAAHEILSSGHGNHHGHGHGHAHAAAKQPPPSPATNNGPARMATPSNGAPGLFIDANAEEPPSSSSVHTLCEANLLRETRCMQNFRPHHSSFFTFGVALLLCRRVSGTVPALHPSATSFVR